MLTHTRTVARVHGGFLNSKAKELKNTRKHAKYYTEITGILKILKHKNPFQTKAMYFFKKRITFQVYIIKHQNLVSKKCNR